MADITAGRNLNPARRHRTCPRAIRRGRHNAYRVKKRGEPCIRHDGPATIRLTVRPAPKPRAKPRTKAQIQAQAKINLS